MQILILNTNIEQLSEVRDSFDCFSSTDGTCKTFDAMWPIIADYQLAITSDITASEFDIRDCNLLISSVGTEYLDGSVIIPGRNKAQSDINYYSNMVDFNQDYLDNLKWYEELIHPIVGGALLYYKSKLSSAQDEYDKWNAKIKAFDAIEQSTCNLFADGQEFRALAQEGFTVLETAITASGINLSYPTGWKTKLYNYEEGQIDKYYDRFFPYNHNNGHRYYDWDAITEFLKADPSSISREEYLAMARIMDEMSDEDLQRLLDENCWTTTNRVGQRFFHEGESIVIAA